LYVLIFLTGRSLHAQDTALKRYGLSFIDQTAVYEQTVQADSAKKMLELRTLIPTLQCDLRYASTNNFVHRNMYGLRTTRTSLRAPAARALAAVQQELREKGYGLKVFDAYRPYYVTVEFWELVKDDRYVANPAKGSGHNRGLAVDLTIIHLETRKELDMGTGFDNFTDSAHHSFTQLPPAVLQNRALLKTTMEKHGFTALETEWWHYAWPNDRNYEVLSLPLRYLAREPRYKL